MSMQLYIINVLVYVHMCVTSQLLKTVFYGQRKKLQKMRKCIITFAFYQRDKTLDVNTNDLALLSCITNVSDE